MCTNPLRTPYDLIIKKEFFGIYDAINNMLGIGKLIMGIKL